MREMGIEAWKWIAAGALMGILTVMMVLGLGARRGTPLYRLRLSLWMLVMGLGGAAGCDSQGITGQPDGSGDPFPEATCYAPVDPGSEPVAEPVADVPDAPDEPDEPDVIMCYDSVIDMGPEPQPDASTDGDEDAVDASTDEEDGD